MGLGLSYDQLPLAIPSLNHHYTHWFLLILRLQAEEDIALNMKLSDSAVMVRSQIHSRGITDKNVLEAMSKVDRSLFVPQYEVPRAFEDHPISIGFGQTISQPYMVAYMTEALHLTASDRVLEIGTGCGYQTAILAEIAQEVYTIEIVEKLAIAASILLEELCYSNIQFHIDDGGKGWPTNDSFDKIIVTAAPEHVPVALLNQLKAEGLLVIPVGASNQQLLRIRRIGELFEKEVLIPVRFVPMTGSVTC